MKRIRAITICLVLWHAAWPALAEEQDVTFVIDDVMQVQEAEVAFLVELVLRAVGPTRVQVEALIDLQDLQNRIEEDLVGKPLVDSCGNLTVLNSIEVEAEDSIVGLAGDLDTRFFECDRAGETGWQRRDQRDRQLLGYSARATAEIVDDCIIFKLLDLTLVPHRNAEAIQGDTDLQTIRVLLLEVVNVLLQRRPLCPELPPELISLDPQFETGGPQEIDEGGLGVFARGSIDVSPETILSIVSVLQENGVIPRAP